MIKPKYKNYSNTTIRVEGSQADITRELARYGIYMVQHTQTNNVFSVAFVVEVEDMPKPVTIRIDIPYTREKDKEDSFGWKGQRIKYRSLFYYVKALLIAWDDGLKTFTTLFMAHIVLPGGKTISQDLLPKYTQALESGQITEIHLLPEGVS